MALREASLRIDEVESSLGEANTHLERTNVELSRERGATGGRSPSAFQYLFVFACFILSPSSELQKMLSRGDDAKKKAEEMKAAAEARVQEILLAHMASLLHRSRRLPHFLSEAPNFRGSAWSSARSAPFFATTSDAFGRPAMVAP